MSDAAPADSRQLDPRGAYVSVMRWNRNLLRRVGLLPRLDRWASDSRMGTWVRSLLAVYDLDDLRQLDVPWWTLDSSEKVEAFLRARPGARVFEWGSGSSTFWLSRRAATVISVEHDPAWAAQMVAAAPSNAHITLVAPTRLSGPGAVTSLKSGFEDLDFREYVAQIDRVDGEFDVIVIDGRAREACLERAVPRLADGGIIVFDNVDRQRYRQAIDSFGDRLQTLTTRGLTPCLPYPTRTALIRDRRP